MGFNPHRHQMMKRCLTGLDGRCQSTELDYNTHRCERCGETAYEHKRDKDGDRIMGDRVYLAGKVNSYDGYDKKPVSVSSDSYVLFDTVLTRPCDTARWRQLTFEIHYDAYPPPDDPRDFLKTPFDLRCPEDDLREVFHKYRRPNLGTEALKSVKESILRSRLLVAVVQPEGSIRPDNCIFEVACAKAGDVAVALLYDTMGYGPFAVEPTLALLDRYDRAIPLCSGNLQPHEWDELIAAESWQAITTMTKPSWEDDPSPEPTPVKCDVCGRVLYHHESIKSGIGPCCAARIGRQVYNRHVIRDEDIVSGE